MRVFLLGVASTMLLSGAPVFAQTSGCDRKPSEMTLEEFGVCQEKNFETQGLWVGDNCSGNCPGGASGAVSTIITPITEAGATEDKDISLSKRVVKVVEPLPQATIELSGDRVVVEPQIGVPGSVAATPASVGAILPAAANLPVKAETEARTASVFFEFGSSDLAVASERELRNSAEAMVRHPNWTLKINGHASADGDDGVNMYLSARRAKAVYADLVARGVPVEQLTYQGFGETQLLGGVQPDSPDNRRVEMILVMTKPK